MRSDFESGFFCKEMEGSFSSAIGQLGRGFGEEDFTQPWKMQQLRFYI
ncbi:hypothetical protein [Algoriphagus boritolerans]|nr:hypothetical protein [Algoriphagus boritolerans]